MRLSNNRRLELYSAVSDPIMDLRIELARGKDLNHDKEADAFDNRLFELEQTIWRRVYAALNLEDPL